MFHSSPTFIKGNYLYPHPSHVIDGEKAVFASNRKFISLMWAGEKWYDRDIRFEMIDGVWYAREMYKGSFDNFFKGKSGWIYKVDPTGFVNDKRLGLQGFEKINKKKVKIVSKKFIPDVWEALQKTRINFIKK